MNNPDVSANTKYTGEHVSVLTLNLRFGLADDVENSWDNRKTTLPLLFKKNKTDFIGLQEANDFQIDFIDNFLTDYDYIGKRSPAPFFWQNNIIFYKKTWECIYYEHRFLSPTPNVPSRFRKSRWPRQATIGMFKKKDKILICAATHFDFDESVQNRSARLIMERISLLPSDVPAVLVGDFNATPYSKCHKLFTGRNNKLKKPFFKDIFNEPFPATHHGFTGSKDGDYIDWILYRGGIIPIEKMVIYGTINGKYPSDHYPVCASFQWA